MKGTILIIVAIAIAGITSLAGNYYLSKELDYTRSLLEIERFNTGQLASDLQAQSFISNTEMLSQPAPVKTVYIEKPVDRPVPFPVETIVEKDRLIKVSAVATRGELIQAYETIEQGIYSHQFYLDNPELQNEISGGTEYNRQWVENYRLLSRLITRAYGVFPAWSYLADNTTTILPYDWGLPEDTEISE
ncbi:MAG: hypothetical protein Q8O55_07820 [Dehalococcoidales bacterium]|nr:hypothetical protein [Dehalococcoidales bacterium]